MLTFKCLLSAGFGVDVDSFVVDTNYDEYAMMLQQTKGRQSVHGSTMVKLYSESHVLKLCVLRNV